MKRCIFILVVAYSFVHCFEELSKVSMVETTMEIDNSKYDYVDNEIDMKRTYRSGVEKFLQGLLHTIGNKQLKNAGNFFSRLPQSVKSLLFTETTTDKSPRANGFGDILNIFQDDFHAVFPGTFWCGDGNVARKNENIGLFAQTDSCCRIHDNCPYSIEAGEIKDHLMNNGIFTRSACSCDLEFYKCLKNVSSLISVNIGTTYFNILRPQCFGYHYPIKTCIKYDTVRLSEKKCFKYELNYLQNKTLEWYDLPDF